MISVQLDRRLQKSTSWPPRESTNQSANHDFTPPTFTAFKYIKEETKTRQKNMASI